jgi:hypothetical protein
LQKKNTGKKQKQQTAKTTTKSKELLIKDKYRRYQLKGQISLIP